MAGPRAFQSREPTRFRVLKVAELAELTQVSFVRWLPAAVARYTPAPSVLGRAGITKHRHWLIRPDAVPQKLNPPVFRSFAIVQQLVRNVRANKSRAPRNENLFVHDFVHDA
jgi:hypothetical protein